MIEYSYTNNLKFVSARPVSPEHRNGLDDIHFTFGDRTYYASLEEVMFMTKCLNAAVYDHRENLRREANAYIHPCLSCGHPTGSPTDTPTTCSDCDGHAFVPSRHSHEERDRLCDICDIAEFEHN